MIVSQPFQSCFPTDWFPLSTILLHRCLAPHSLPCPPTMMECQIPETMSQQVTYGVLDPPNLEL